jgi:hypothetical protein
MTTLAIAKPIVTSFFNSLVLAKFNQQFVLANKPASILYISPNGYIQKVLPHIKVSGLSGLYIPAECIKTDPNFQLLFSKILFRFVVDVLAYTKVNNPTDLGYHIEYFLQSSKITYTPYYYPLAQHIITSVMAFVRFDPSILPDITDNCINYKYYMNSPIMSQAVIEAIIVKKTIGKLLMDNKETLYTIAPNPDNPQSDHFYFRNQCYAMTKQPHADFRTNVFCVETYNNKNIFYDVKSRGDPVSSLPLLTGYLSLTQHLNGNMLINRHAKEAYTLIPRILNYSNPITFDRLKPLGQITYIMSKAVSSQWHPELISTLTPIIHNAPIDEHFWCITSELDKIDQGKDTLTYSESKMILMFILFLATSKWASIIKAMPKLLVELIGLNNQWHHYYPTNPNFNIKKMILISFNQLIFDNTSFFSLRTHFTAKFQTCSIINNLNILLNVLRKQGVYLDLKRLYLIVGLIQRLIQQYKLLFCVFQGFNQRRNPNHL